MTSDRKVLFFDVDGTLVSESKNIVPDSSVDALTRAMERGHLVFVNSGRPRCELRFLEDTVPADGFLCGCGTEIVVHGESRFHRSISVERGRQIRQLILDCGMDAWLEASDRVCFRENPPVVLPRIAPVRENMMRKYSDLMSSWEDPDCVFDKCCVVMDENSDLERFYRGMYDMDVIDRGDGMLECVPADCSKATAMEWVLREYGLPRESAYVFGDSTNDIAMFEFAPNRIAMGVHSPELERFNPFITKTVEEGGVAWAMEQLGII